MPPALVVLGSPTLPACAVSSFRPTTLSFSVAGLPLTVQILGTRVSRIAFRRRRFSIRPTPLTIRPVGFVSTVFGYTTFPISSVSPKSNICHNTAFSFLK